ncbi:MAG: hypothetical protein MZV63_48270 [Marinilabiliales bacterium]|nr:hypothetical protein [Marinilabiliales bacterium]
MSTGVCTALFLLRHVTLPFLRKPLVTAINPQYHCIDRFILIGSVL